MVSADDHSSRRQSQVVRAFKLRLRQRCGLDTTAIMYHLRPTQHHAIEENAQLLKGGVTGSFQTVFLDGCENLVVPEACMLHRTVSAIYREK